MSMAYEKSENLAGQLQAPYRIQFLHPHPLTLEPNYGFSCCACHSNQHEGLVLRCHECDFNLHLECTFINKDEQLRTRSTHQHPLMRFINVPKDSIHCRCCGKYCSEPTYACFPCNLFLHPSCYDPNFPPVIKHFYHKCPLSLYAYYPDQSHPCICRACYQPLHTGTLSYGCSRCGFEMHQDCTLWEPTGKSSQEHFLHGHPLMPLLSMTMNMIKDGDTHDTSVNCYACKKRCTDVPTYACFHPSCKKVYICKTCLELPKEICHPFHPYHTLTLLQQYRPDLRQIDWTGPIPGSICNACRKDTNIVVYICQSDHNCNFRLHVGCSEARAAIQYEGHNHLLHVKEINIEDGHKLLKNCSACNYYFVRDSYAFSCLNCETFNLHLTCGPIPHTIKHKCHIDQLMLTHSLATYEDETEDEFYCDACEEERDPLLPIYQCVECKFASHVQCVISEVIPSLKAERGDVELITPNGQLVRMITKEAAKQMVQEKEKQLQLEPNLILYKILKSLSEAEKKELGTVLEAIERETATAKEILFYDPDEAVLFSDKAYTQFIEFLDHDTQNIPTDQYDQGSFLDLIEQFSEKLDHKEEAVNVGDYVVTQKLAPILKNLLSKGDISAESLLSRRVKVFLFHMLCECIYSMKNIRVMDITPEFLLKWSTVLKTLQRAGFSIQFVVDHFKRVSCASIGLYVRKERKNALDQINRDIEALKVKRERIISAESTKSTFIKEFLREVSPLKRWKAGTGLP